MKRYKYSTFADYVNKFSRKRILVIGDLLLDQYIWGSVSRISPEAPVPVVWVQKEDFMPGGACNVASNLAEFGARVMLAGVIGKDARGEILKSRLRERNIAIEGVFADGERPTSQKTRVIAHSQQVVRIDREGTDAVGKSLTKKIIDYVRQNIRAIDGIVLEDYGKGIITPALLGPVVSLARKHGKIVAVDPKENHFSYYKGISVVTPNHHEAARAVGFPLENTADIEKAGERLLKKLKADNVLITLGEKGMMLFGRSGKPHRIPTLAQEVFDVSGAGDTVIAVYTLSVVCGASSLAAAHIANCAAGIVVGKVGVAVVNKKELLTKLRQVTGRKGL
ncbi:MAG: D-glycero-beta-D-manno-heptose-7-phosphate kinase [Candidatus Omnitrophica bacterium]|nr:D-glycero-beta-D-manno-heptose-7-phosphate kinase [Candidatus Omnitrophota bacterium]